MVRRAYIIPLSGSQDMAMLNAERVRIGNIFNSARQKITLIENTAAGESTIKVFTGISKYSDLENAAKEALKIQTNATDPFAVQSLNLKETTGSTPASGLVKVYADASAVPNVRYRDDSGKDIALHYLNNYSTGTQAPAASTRTYISGSAIAVPKMKLQVGSCFRWMISMTKTAAGTAPSTYDICFGTAGTTADTARVSFTKPAGSSASDDAHVIINMVIRSIGATGVAYGHFSLTHNLAATGFAVIPCVSVSGLSAGFDMTVEDLIVGVCITTGASEAVTVQMVQAEAWNL